MQLTEHFSLSEFTRSSTASRLGIDNTIPEALIPNLRNLCEQVLEPLRESLTPVPSPEGEGRLKGEGEAPIIISSGYRCEALNKAVGGVSNSQHLLGEAVDIKPPTWSPERELYSPEGRRRILASWAEWIMDNCCFDQLIIERAQSASWLHVSCKLDKSKNRQQVLVINNK